MASSVPRKQAWHVEMHPIVNSLRNEAIRCGRDPGNTEIDFVKLFLEHARVRAGQYQEKRGVIVPPCVPRTWDYFIDESVLNVLERLEDEALSEAFVARVLEIAQGHGASRLARVLGDGPLPYNKFYDTILNKTYHIVWMSVVTNLPAPESGRSPRFRVVHAMQIIGLVPLSQVLSRVRHLSQILMRAPPAIPQDLPISNSGGYRSADILPLTFGDELNDATFGQNEMGDFEIAHVANPHARALNRALLNTDWMKPSDMWDIIETARIKFQLSEQEQAVVCAQQNVLLLGRSGTGKSTCAMLRLFSQIKAFERNLGAQLLDSRSVRDILHADLVHGGAAAERAKKALEERTASAETAAESAFGGIQYDVQLRNVLAHKLFNVALLKDEAAERRDDTYVVSQRNESVGAVQEYEIEQRTTNFHPVFLTVSPILCGEIRNFYESMERGFADHMTQTNKAAGRAKGADDPLKADADIGKAAAADDADSGSDDDDAADDDDDDFLGEVDFEAKMFRDVPHTFAHMVDEHFPLFLTLRRFLFMLDGTLQQPFFCRDKLTGAIEGADDDFSWSPEKMPTVRLNHRVMATDEEAQAIREANRRLRRDKRKGATVADDDDWDMLDDDDGGDGMGEEDDDDDLDEIVDVAAYRRARDRKRLVTAVVEGFEVDYDYFEHHIYPAIFRARRLDPRVEHRSVVDSYISPSTVYTEIMSVIKGSALAVQSHDGYLDLASYVGLGRRGRFFGDLGSDVAAEVAMEIYSLFEAYRDFCSARSLFDLQDLISHIYRRIRHEGYHGVDLHSISVDEVQDFSMSALQLLFSVCQNPNAGFFFAGDTCQTIARGIGFRFCDLRAIFGHTSSVLESIDVPSVQQLTVNFRSHGNIINIGHSVVNMLAELFPLTIDKLAMERGANDGPMPVLLDLDSTEALYRCLLNVGASTASGGSSNIEFGAQQVILVRNKEAKASLPDILSHALCLTVEEAKGLEFDDVLLFNFFTNSPSPSAWQNVVRENLMTPSRDKSAGQVDDGRFKTITFDDMDLTADGNGSAGVIRGNGPTLVDYVAGMHLAKASGEFHPGRNNILASELKHLYTAITRPRKRLFIFDENQRAARPMYAYWAIHRMVEVWNESAFSQTEFARKTGPEEWRQQARTMLRRRFYAQAVHCAKEAGDERLCKRASAHLASVEASRMKTKRLDLEPDAERCGNSHRDRLRRQEAKAEIKELEEAYVAKYTEAAELFTELGLHRHAAGCFQQSDMSKAADAWTALGEHARAGECFLRTGEVLLAAKAFALAGHFGTAIDHFLAADDRDSAIAVILSDAARSADVWSVLVDKYVPRFLRGLLAEADNDKDRIEWSKVLPLVTLLVPDGDGDDDGADAPQKRGAGHDAGDDDLVFIGENGALEAPAAIFASQAVDVLLKKRLPHLVLMLVHKFNHASADLMAARDRAALELVQLACLRNNADGIEAALHLLGRMGLVRQHAGLFFDFGRWALATRICAEDGDGPDALLDATLSMGGAAAAWAFSLEHGTQLIGGDGAAMSRLLIGVAWAELVGLEPTPGVPGFADALATVRALPGADKAPWLRFFVTLSDVLSGKMRVSRPAPNMTVVANVLLLTANLACKTGAVWTQSDLLDATDAYLSVVNQLVRAIQPLTSSADATKDGDDAMAAVARRQFLALFGASDPFDRAVREHVRTGYVLLPVGLSDPAMAEKGSGKRSLPTLLRSLFGVRTGKHQRISHEPNVYAIDPLAASAGGVQSRMVHERSFVYAALFRTFETAQGLVEQSLGAVDGMVKTGLLSRVMPGSDTIAMLRRKTIGRTALLDDLVAVRNRQLGQVDALQRIFARVRSGDDLTYRSLTATAFWSIVRARETHVLRSVQKYFRMVHPLISDAELARLPPRVRHSRIGADLHGGMAAASDAVASELHATEANVAHERMLDAWTGLHAAGCSYLFEQCLRPLAMHSDLRGPHAVLLDVNVFDAQGDWYAAADSQLYYLGVFANSLNVGQALALAFDGIMRTALLLATSDEHMAGAVDAVVLPTSLVRLWAEDERVGSPQGLAARARHLRVQFKNKTEALRSVLDGFVRLLVDWVVDELVGAFACNRIGVLLLALGQSDLLACYDRLEAIRGIEWAATARAWCVSGDDRLIEAPALVGETKTLLAALGDDLTTVAMRTAAPRLAAAASVTDGSDDVADDGTASQAGTAPSSDWDRASVSTEESWADAGASSSASISHSGWSDAGLSQESSWSDAGAGSQMTVRDSASVCDGPGASAEHELAALRIQRAWFDHKNSMWMMLAYRDEILDRARRRIAVLAIGQAWLAHRDAYFDRRYGTAAFRASALARPVVEQLQNVALDMLSLYLYSPRSLYWYDRAWSANVYLQAHVFLACRSTGAATWRADALAFVQQAADERAAVDRAYIAEAEARQRALEESRLASVKAAVSDVVSRRRKMKGRLKQALLASKNEGKGRSGRKYRW